MLILPLASEHANLATAGGKGMNLARLAKAGLPVPDGFFITTGAYQEFVAANNLKVWIDEQVTDLDRADPFALDAASSAIRKRFSAGTIPEHITSAMRRAYNSLVRASNAENAYPDDAREFPLHAVAVRSSATAEDLPELSFAGQQDTFLHVLGEGAFLQAVVDCWSSLWTARAIGYRKRNDISQDDIALSVIVQLMIPSEVSGVLFTANPINGKRTEMVIDATWGLGEALVSGHVEPDQYVVRAADSHIISKTLGSKALAIHGQVGGGTITVSGGAEKQALPDKAIARLAALGREVQTLFASPQDIEWAWCDGKLWLLQSRPVTSLYPLFAGIDPGTQPVRAMFSFGAVQGHLDPMTTMGRDNIRAVFAGAARLFGFEVTVETEAVIFAAGQRLFVDVTSLLRHPIGRKFMINAMRFIEPGSASVIAALTQDPRFQISGRWFKLATAKRVGRFMMPIIARYLRAVRHPDRMRLKFQVGSEALVAEFSQRVEAAHSLAERIAAYEEAIANVFPYLLPRFIPTIGVAMASLHLLNRFASAAGRDNALAITGGVPHNVTTEMDLALWDTA